MSSKPIGLVHEEDSVEGVHVLDLDVDEETGNNLQGRASGSVKRKRPLKSQWWQYFEMILEVAGEEKRCKCKACGTTYKADSSMWTGNLQRHILKQCPRQRTRDIAQTLLEQGDKSLAIRNSARTDILKMHKNEYNRLAQEMRSCPGKICFTSDLWTSIATDGYLIQCLGNSEKGFTITLDNAAANDVFVGLLRDHLSLNCSLVNGGEFLHVRCCAHILNLIVQEGLKIIDHSVDKIRECVKYVKGSQVRKKKFVESVTQTSLDHKKSLRQDVPTRWNSTYLMLSSAIYYRRAFNHLKLTDTNFTHCPLVDEWVQDEKYANFLRCFRNLTSTRKIYNILLSIAMIVDPRFKMQFIEFCYNKLYGHGSNELSLVKSKLVSLFEEYMGLASKSSSSNTSTSSHSGIDDNASLPLNSDSGCMDVFKEFDTFQITELNDRVQKSQLDLYLDEPKIDRSSNCDVLAFWKAYPFRYPELAQMARDILSVPISTVASESAFSRDGRILDQYRSAIKPDVVEALKVLRVRLDDLIENVMNLFINEDAGSNNAATDD
ncbi:zinc finger BED domain-containing protein RICESLEEPER 2-like [Primulina eburnea]|uniref:zinc finger BED domain-containing protein RICESLEEPER 2-like n=1 Tax=Primulina eburnea TaxID=1245227 RepID=UPI003C6CB365